MRIEKPNLSFHEPLRPLQQITAIVIHHTQEDGWDVYKTHQYHQSLGWSGIGYNYFIEEDGTIFEGRGLYEGAHAKGYNASSVGICMSGNFDKIVPTQSQMTSSYAICKTLLSDYKLTAENVIGHREIEGVTKTCPGLNFNMDEFRAQIKKLLL
jgi:N-acetylmuramoyl-L-alanine amidase